MKDDYYLMEPPPVEAVEACPCCGSSARVWVYSEDPTMPVTRVVMCDHSDSIGPRDSLVYEGCLLQMPPDDFYRETGRDAVRYWNEYAKALTAAQRANRWNTSQVLRGPQSDIAAAAHAQGLRERIKVLEASDALQPCGHPKSLVLHSAESGEPLYCEACDDKSGRRDAELRESELAAANVALRERIAGLEAQRVPLTDEQITQIAHTPEPVSVSAVHTFARAVERAHGIEGGETHNADLSGRTRSA